MSSLLKVFVVIAVLAGAHMSVAPQTRPSTRPDEGSERRPDFFTDIAIPPYVEADGFAKWQEVVANNPPVARFKYTRLEYRGCTFWVVEFSLGNGIIEKTIGVYAPEKDGSFRRCV